MIGVLLAWVACTPVTSPAQDARVFAEVLKAPKADGAMARCGEIGDPNTRGECQMKVALNRADQGAGCGEVDAGLYFDECFFMAAEAARRRGAFDDAVRLCADSGVFLEDCQQHLWQGELRGVMVGNAALTERYGRAKQVFCRWHGSFDDVAEFEQRFWDKAWNSALAGGRTIDVELCGELPEHQQERCEKAGASLLAARLDEVMVHADARQTLCAGGLPELSLLAYRPHAVLDAVVDRHRRAVCVDGLERPEGRGAPEITADTAIATPERCE